MKNVFGIKPRFAQYAVFILGLCGLVHASSVQALEAVPKPIGTNDQVNQYFARTNHFIQFSPDFDTNQDIAIYIAPNVALYVDFQDPRLPPGISVIGEDRSITLHPNTFNGGAFSSADLGGSDPIYVPARNVSSIISEASDYRELCAFDNRLGGPVIAGSVMATLSNGDVLSLGAEVGTTSGNFSAIADATEAGGPVISWPNKFCRGVKRATGSCNGVCGMTLGDMIDLAAMFGAEIPGNILSAGVDAVTEWMIGEGYVVSGNCGQVQLIFPPIPLGCQCIYVQF